MKVIIPFLLSAVMVIGDVMSMRTEVYSPHLKSKIANGDLAQKGQHNYMASLQLNGSHICCSGLFKKGFLLTTALCAWHIGNGIQREMKRATAVLGDMNLKNGQRINILKIAYHSRRDIGETIIPKSEYDSGVVMLADTIDYTRAQILDLLDHSFNLHIDKYESVVCGWGTVTEDDHKYYRLENAEYSEDLHCMNIILRNETICRNAIPGGNYRNKLICGKAKLTEQITSLRDIGSPLTKFINVDGEAINYIIGITLTRFIGEDGVYLRFHRSYAAFKGVQKLLESIQSDGATNGSCVKGSRSVLKDEPSEV